MQNLREKNKTIATLNGSFDLMHSGHLRIIYEASRQADILIVALNTDSSIQRYKSKKRPIVELKYRIEMVSSLLFVDYVTSFDEIDPIKILSIIKPDVHINGKEYSENCIEADIVKKNGGKIHIVDLVDSLSTTNIIQKIKLCE
ncbi:MAG: Bifunctional protein HldE [Candidatus Anoxychlamydiales bacterium]|nr:Bifunctional protein HldE [Candidatus Anoxychlamydiales bacterium]